MNCNYSVNTTFHTFNFIYKAVPCLNDTHVQAPTNPCRPFFGDIQESSVGFPVLKMQSLIQFCERLLFELNSQSNYNPFFQAPEAVDWLGLFFAEPLCSFLIYRARAVYEHRRFFFVQTPNGQLEDDEEQFTEKVHGIKITDYTFKSFPHTLRSLTFTKICELPLIFRA